MEVNLPAARAASSSRNRAMELSRRRGRDLAWELRRWSYVDLGGGPEDTVLVAGSGRSGTTWVEELLNRNNDFRILFEPFWGKQVREVRHFSDHQYLPPGNDDPLFVEPVGRILSGRVRNRWIDHQNTARLPRRRLVKEIRANNWLGWAADHWPRMKVVFIVRHPIAVVSSGKSLGWDDGLGRLLAQPNLLSDWLDADGEEYVRSLTDPWQRAIARWCIENLVPFRTLGPTRATLVLYEALASRSEAEIDRILEAVGQRRDERLAEATVRPSRLARSGTSPATANPTDRWLASVNAMQRRQAVDVIERLGFGEVFGDDPMPDAVAAHRLWAQAPRRPGSLADGESHAG
jgi:hypothetical protein